MRYTLISIQVEILCFPRRKYC